MVRSSGLELLNEGLLKRSFVKTFAGSINLSEFLYVGGVPAAPRGQKRIPSYEVNASIVKVMSRSH